MEAGYNKNKTEFLFNGFHQGFRLNCASPPSSFTSTNLKSALQLPDIISEKIQKELAASRIAGPFVDPPFENFVCSPLGLCPKKQEGDFRMIHHLSYPENNSVNSGIPEEFSTVSYATIQQAIATAKVLGKGSFLAKSDIKSAFRLLPIHPSDYYLLVFFWDEKFYYDRCLPMGCSASCQLFEEFSSALEYLVAFHTHQKVIHVLDDFLFLAKNQADCQIGLHYFLDLCKKVGVPIAHEKTVFLTTNLTFLGIELDTITQIARLPDDKITKCTSMLQTFLSKKKVSLKNLQSLLGWLNFATSVVPGRPFLRRLFDKTKGLRKPYFKTNLNKETKADIRTWLQFLKNYNGKSFFRGADIFTSESLKLYTDAAQEHGFGAVFEANWFYGEWPNSWKGYNITILELFPIVLALEIWGDKLKSKCIRLFTDNIAVMHIINKQTSKDPIIMILIRRLVLHCLKHNIEFQAEHVPGKVNVLADSLSRLQVQRFRQLAMGFNLNPDPIPSLPESLS